MKQTPHLQETFYVYAMKEADFLWNPLKIWDRLKTLSTGGWQDEWAVFWERKSLSSCAGFRQVIRENVQNPIRKKKTGIEPGDVTAVRKQPSARSFYIPPILAGNIAQKVSLPKKLFPLLCSCVQAVLQQSSIKLSLHNLPTFFFFWFDGLFPSLSPLVFKCQSCFFTSYLSFPFASLFIVSRHYRTSPSLRSTVRVSFRLFDPPPLFFSFLTAFLSS